MKNKEDEAAVGLKAHWIVGGFWLFALIAVCILFEL